MKKGFSECGHNYPFVRRRSGNHADPQATVENSLTLSACVFAERNVDPAFWTITMNAITSTFAMLPCSRHFP